MNVLHSMFGSGRIAILACGLSASALLVPVSAHADCNTDIGALMKVRLAGIDALNQITKTHGGKLDATLACPKLRSLAAAEGQIVAYMTKNKDWCNIPDDIVSKMSASRIRTSGIAVKACDFAVKIKKMQSQQAQAAQQQQLQQQQQQALKLPTGPL